MRPESNGGDRSSREVQRPHKLLISDRQSVSIEGVADVRSFDDEEVILQTSAGTLLIRGSGLHIRALNLETGNATIEGRLDAMEYEETKEKKRGLFVRLFRDSRRQPVRVRCDTGRPPSQGRGNRADRESMQVWQS